MPVRWLPPVATSSHRSQGRLAPTTVFDGLCYGSACRGGNPHTTIVVSLRDGRAGCRRFGRGPDHLSSRGGGRAPVGGSHGAFRRCEASRSFGYASVDPTEGPATPIRSARKASGGTIGLRGRPISPSGGRTRGPIPRAISTGRTAIGPGAVPQVARSGPASATAPAGIPTGKKVSAVRASRCVALRPGGLTMPFEGP